MEKIEYFLYGGLFLAGAIFTPVMASLTKGDGPGTTEETTATNPDNSGSNESLFGTGASENMGASESSAAAFAENDDREKILKDYETTSPAELRKIPTAIPQFALNQPTVQPYPNYWANIQIPTFNAPPLTLPEPQSTPPTTGDHPQSGTETVSLPGFDSLTKEPFQVNTPTPSNGDLELRGKIQTPNTMDLKDFINSAPARELKLL
ncbi:MAG: hypothetical protein VKJ86_01415 [Synechococcus sp.]|nr:hypothetical protein [Synechococcus sp.]